MSASLSRLSTAGRVARFQASRAVAQIMAQQHETQRSLAMLRSDDQEIDLPSLRARLEHDISAMEWDTFSPSINHDTVNTNNGSSLRSGTTAVAARLAKAAECPLEPNASRYLPSAAQCLIVTAEPSRGVMHAAQA